MIKRNLSNILGNSSDISKVKGAGLSRTLLFWFLCLSLVPLVVVSIVSTRNAHQSLQQNADLTMVTYMQGEADFVQFYFDRLLDDINLQSNDQDNILFLTELREAYDGSKLPLLDYVESPRWALISDEWALDLNTFKKTYGYSEVYLIDVDGNILFNTTGGSDLGSNVFRGGGKPTLLAQACQKSFETGETIFSDFEQYAPAGGIPVGFLTSMLVNDFGEKIGLVALQITLNEINTIMQSADEGEGNIETYLIGSDMRRRSVPVLDKEFKAWGELVATEQAQTWHEVHCLTGKMECDHSPLTYLGPHGQSVLGMHSHMIIAGVPLGIIAEIPESVAFASAARLKSITIIMILITAAVVIGLTLMITGRIVKPMRHLSGIANQIAEGDLDISTQYENRTDELGELARSFNNMGESLRQQAELAKRIADGDLQIEVKPKSDKDVLGNALGNMVKNLREQLGSITEATEVLAASASQISSLTAQLSSSTIESSTALAQTTTTVEELRQTSAVSNDKAKRISKDFEKTAEISREGEQATNNTINGMNKIKEQMETIAESIVSLSEQSQAVGEIISSVDDMAEQSNLLAVNAAIEAARAGEQGRGFSVVAEEIKSLAEQSKRATGQVRNILNEIQKATNNAVMVTDQGSEVVDSGTGQTTQAASAIRNLTANVSVAAEAATQIAASSQQQLAGVDQIKTAMESIKQASDQNIASSGDLEKAGKDLNQLGTKLKEMVARYSV